MCGIVGFDFDDKQLLKEMMKLISHRGSDQTGTFFDSRVSLGHQRLSIIDLSENGRQPMPDQGNDCWIVFNGEIYNYKELRSSLEKRGYRFNSNSDTEVIVNAYAEYDEECVKFLNGDFAFCIYDSKKQRFFLARDRLGIKPLYYYFDGKNFMFASEYKAFMPYIQKSSVNKIALSRYITFRYNYGRETLVNDVHRVLPGEKIIYDLNTKKLSFNRYWEVDYTGKESKAPLSSMIKQTRMLLADSVNKRLMSDVPLGVYLSGGIDSASIVALMHQGGAKDIKTFSVGFGYGMETDEVKYSRMISEKFSTDHKEFIVSSDIALQLPKIVWHCDEPLADPALLPVYYLSEKTKPHATVVLTGDGGDEVFAGYEQNKFLKLGRMPAPIRRMGIPAVSMMPSKGLGKFFKYAPKLGSEGKKRAIQFLKKDKPLEQYLEIVSIFSSEEKAKLGKGMAGALPPINPELERFFNDKNPVLHQVLKLEYETQLPENMLHKGDRMSMAHGVEARVPFLDHRLVEFSETIPARYKLKYGINGFTEKFILRKAVSDILPKEIAMRKKQRFYVPIDRWLDNELAPMVDELLSVQALNDSDVFNPEFVQSIRDKYKSSPLFYARQLWVLLTFQLWHKQFILGDRTLSERKA